MIAAAGASEPAAINEQRNALENSINRIEAGFGPPPQVIAPPRPAAPTVQQKHPPVQPVSAPQQGAVAPDPQGQAARQPAPSGRPDPAFAAPRGPASPVEGEYYPEVGFELESDDRPVYRRQSNILRRVVPILLLVAVLGLAGWLTFSLVNMLLNGGSQTAQGANPSPAEGGEAPAGSAADFITVLSPTDTSALQTDGRGTAEIINQANNDMIRLVSVRAQGKADTPAEPILLEIAAGTLSQVAGKKMTVEIQAKSGSSSPATFAIGCDFDGQDACGRKRFRVGLQPEAIVFTVSFPQTLAQGGKAYLTLNTDVTSTATQSLEGDPVDIGYARLRFAKQ